MSTCKEARKPSRSRSHYFLGHADGVPDSRFQKRSSHLNTFSQVLRVMHLGSLSFTDRPALLPNQTFKNKDGGKCPRFKGKGAAFMGKGSSKGKGQSIDNTTIKGKGQGKKAIGIMTIIKAKDPKSEGMDITTSFKGKGSKGKGIYNTTPAREKIEQQSAGVDERAGARGTLEKTMSNIAALTLAPVQERIQGQSPGVEERGAVRRLLEKPVTFRCAGWLGANEKANQRELTKLQENWEEHFTEDSYNACLGRANCKYCNAMIKYCAVSISHHLLSGCAAKRRSHRDKSRYPGV